LKKTKGRKRMKRDFSSVYLLRKGKKRRDERPRAPKKRTGKEAKGPFAQVLLRQKG